MTISFRLDGRVALVTGAAQGLGQAMAIALAEAGADIAGVDVGALDETRAGVEAAGRKFMAIAENLRGTAAARRVVERAASALGRLDILVNNAGIIRRADSIEFTEADWDDVIDINLKSVFFLAQAAARQFLAQGGGGKIVNIASMLSFQGGIRVPSYTAAKSGVRGPHAAARERMGAEGDQRQRHRARATWRRRTPRRCAPTRTAAPKSSGASRPAAGASPRIWPARSCSSLVRGRLRARLGDRRRRRLARPLGAARRRRAWKQARTRRAPPC